MLPIWYKQYKNLIDKSIKNYLEKYFIKEKNPGLDIIKEASIYACNGGKRIRSILALEFFLIFSKTNFEEIKQNDDIIKFCIALELIHAYSLVHDDLPAMDNDILRRGEETTWKKFGETNAILVGDLLNSMAFEILGKIKKGNILTSYLGEAVGLKGMLGGQVLDIFYENNKKLLNLENLIEIHNKKTGALIKCSIIGGIIIAESKIINDENLKKYLDFGEKIGLAFQIKDDLLDEEGTIQETGKSVGSSEQKGFVFFLGIEKTKKYLDNLIFDCKKISQKLNSKKLNFLIEYIQKRKK